MTPGSANMGGGQNGQKSRCTQLKLDKFTKNDTWAKFSLNCNARSPFQTKKGLNIDLINPVIIKVLLSLLDLS